MQEGAADARKVFGGGGQHRAVASAREARRTAPPPASTTHHGSHSPFVGDTPCRAGPRLPCPFGRSRLSAGAAQSSAPQRRAALAVPEPPGLNKEKKEGRTKARTQQTQEQGQEEEEEEGPGQQQEEAGGANRQGERMRTGQLLAPEPLAAARDLAGLSKYRTLPPKSTWCRGFSVISK